MTETSSYFFLIENIIFIAQKQYKSKNLDKLGKLTPEY
jgi:hypothetical protein